jgi:hypothetical protein
MKTSEMIGAMLTTWSTPLNSLRLLALLAFASVVVALLFPATQQFLTGACVSFTGLLAVQLFRIKRIEEKPDPRDQDMTTLHLTNS